MNKFQDKYRIESSRLKNWDYASNGWYFVTICTRERECFFGDMVSGYMKLSTIGHIVSEEWQKTEHIRPNVKLDEWTIMPNHVHGIIIIKNKPAETSRRDVSTHLKPNSLGSIICQFKSKCTKRIRLAGFGNFAWQSRYHDHIIRNEKSLYKIRKYIFNNTLKWEFDSDNPANL